MKLRLQYHWLLYENMSAKEWAALIAKNQDLAAKIHLSCNASNFSMPKTEPYQI